MWLSLYTPKDGKARFSSWCGYQMYSKATKTKNTVAFYVIDKFDRGGMQSLKSFG